MYPLIATAIASTAGNLLDRWTQSFAPKPAAAAVSFQHVLDALRSSANSAQSGAALGERLRGELLAAPEIRATLGSTDPLRSARLHLSSDGMLSLVSQGGTPRLIAVSPDTAALARKLAGVLMPNGIAQSVAL
jgi:hypothetical protein